MGEYDDTLTLEGKIAVDFAHAMIAYNGDVDADIVCEMAQAMMIVLKERGMIREMAVSKEPLSYDSIAEFDKKLIELQTAPSRDPV